MVAFLFAQHPQCNLVPTIRLRKLATSALSTHPVTSKPKNQPWVHQVSQGQRHKNVFWALTPVTVEELLRCEANDQGWQAPASADAQAFSVSKDHFVVMASSFTCQCNEMLHGAFVFCWNWWSDIVYLLNPWKAAFGKYCCEYCILRYLKKGILDLIFASGGHQTCRQASWQPEERGYKRWHHVVPVGQLALLLFVRAMMGIFPVVSWTGTSCQNPRKRISILGVLVGL